MAAAGPGGITGVTFDSDGHRLVGTLYLARGDDPKPTALLLHGCPGIEKNLDLAAALRDGGWNALVFHYRGCWGSGGRYDLRTITTDIAAAARYLRSGAHRSVDAYRLAVIGHSLGGWAGILAAAGDEGLRAVAACAAPASLDVLGGLSGEDTDREFVRFLATTEAQFAAQRAEVAARPGPLQAAASVSPRPLLIVHGSDDEWVPRDHGRALYEHAARPSRYVEINGANHAFSWHRAELRDVLLAWLEESDV